MIEQELLLLGLLREGPKHGYEIKLKIKEILFLFAGIDIKSIYYPLRVLEKKGMVAKKTDKAGRRPQRFVYQLTSRGRKRFEELLARSFLDFKRPQFSLDLSLYFLAYINPAVARRRMRARQQILKKISKGLKKTAKSLDPQKELSLVRILDHNSQMLEAEYRFLCNFQSETESGAV